MTFHSIEFFILFLSVLYLYFALPTSWRNPLLLIASATFYMWWRPLYIVFILFSVTVDYFVALRLDKQDSPGRRRFLLITSLVSNLGLLFFFKYWDFASRTLASLVGAAGVAWEPPLLELVLPIGISFHTFQALSYTIDVYRGESPVERSLPRLWLFVLFFPQLVAGPIERARNLLPQFSEHHAFDGERVSSGLRLMLWGLVKKVALADHLAAFADPVFERPRDYQGLEIAAAAYAFAFQIYADFSAYSDIAVGAATALGFRLMNNFDRPYLAASPAEFWRRWHISLSTWFRDYVYVPLGGSRGGGARWAAAILGTFLLSGLWHGARWTFVLWGAYHGLLILLWRGAEKLPGPTLPRALKILATFHLGVLGWILFRAPSLEAAATFVSRLFTEPFLAARGVSPAALWCAAGVLILLWVDARPDLRERPWRTPLRWAAYATGALLVLGAAREVSIPFIYFQF